RRSSDLGADAASAARCRSTRAPQTARDLSSSGGAQGYRRTEHGGGKHASARKGSDAEVTTTPGPRDAQAAAQCVHVGAGSAQTGGLIGGPAKAGTYGLALWRD